jgi:ectoine hydroxylase-related dioxygenase (phytanoyl-CoA dioxygenase family)
MISLRQQVEDRGFAMIPSCLTEDLVAAFCNEFGENQASQRNILAISCVRSLAQSLFMRQTVELILGKGCFAVRGIFFNKTEEANWKVTWHQDLTIAVRERINLEGFGPWSSKDDVLHVQPPDEIMNSMLAIRVHLDESCADNGPLRVISASHKMGRLPPEQVTELAEGKAETCCVPKGGAFLMKPMLLHASSKCTAPKPRRVIHLEFANSELPGGLEWAERI